jgi:hypothetical protein
MRMIRSNHIWLLAGFALGSASCADLMTLASPAQPRPAGVMPLFADQDQMKDEILKHVTIGDPADKAARIMRQQDFHCRTSEAETHHLQLECHASESTRPPMTLDVWVTMDCDGSGHITDINVRTKMDGP